MELSKEEIFDCLMKKINETEYLIKECSSLSDVSGKAKLQRKIEAELRFLQRVSIFRIINFLYLLGTGIIWHLTYQHVL